MALETLAKRIGQHGGVDAAMRLLKYARGFNTENTIKNDNKTSLGSTNSQTTIITTATTTTTLNQPTLSVHGVENKGEVQDVVS